MAVQTCPAGNKKGFTWFVDEDPSDSTLWHCVYCGYAAEEDEAKESYCFKCQNKSNMLLTDKAGQFKFCYQCAIKSEFEGG